MPNKSLDHKIFLSAIPVVIIFALGSAIENYFIGLYFLSFLCVIVFVYYVAIFKIARKEKYYKVLLIPSIILPTVICTCAWFYTQGSYGSTNTVMFVLLVFLMCIVKLKNHIWILISICLILTFLSISEYYFPNSIQKKFDSPGDRFIDFYITSIMCYITAYFLIGFVIKNYVKQRKTSEEQKVEIILQKEELQLQSKNLEELNSLKDKLFSVISHDIRTPIISIKSVLELVNNDDISEDEFKKILPEILRNIDSASMLIDNTLHWVKDQMKGEKAIIENFNLTELAASNINQLKVKLFEKDITIVNQLYEPFDVRADKEMVNLVLRNLFLNAIKFSNRGESIYISAVKINQEIEVCIKDNGIGMNPEKLGTLFNDKIQFAAFGTENEKGSGLGLLLCKDFIEKSNGSIRAESELGKGSKFCFKLPAQNQNL